MPLARANLHGLNTSFALIAALHHYMSSLKRHFSTLITRRQVFSDEFEQDGRTFEDGADPRWTAIDKNDCKDLLSFVALIHVLSLRNIISIVHVFHSFASKLSSSLSQ